MMHKLILFLCCYFVLLSFSIVTAEIIEIKSGLYNVQVKSIDKCAGCEDKNKITLKITDKKSGTEKEIIF